ncbi:hypothetical protein [Piscinibacter sp. XHJ-5]|uniref:hypothetical protein n=1 Tax=Piscinibacter sp. XHJ-5 TaxID=3037797 RepID=UPI00245290FE|nr:hypothetical protein [Piscinibacter sp. XHJ-5]
MKATPLLLAASLGLTAACAAPGIQADKGSMQALIGDAACSTDAQCKTMPVGAKACGGPQSYLAWSSARTEEAALRSMSDASAEADRKQAEAKGMASTCTVVPDPGAFCDMSQPTAGSPGSCRLRSGKGGGALAR